MTDKHSRAHTHTRTEMHRRFVMSDICVRRSRTVRYNGIFCLFMCADLDCRLHKHSLRLNVRIKLCAVFSYTVSGPAQWADLAADVRAVPLDSLKLLKWKYVNSVMLWCLMCSYMWVMLRVSTWCQKMNNDSAICLGDTCIRVCYLIAAYLTTYWESDHLDSSVWSQCFFKHFITRTVACMVK